MHVVCQADYSIVAYALAKFTAALPLTILYSFIFCVATLPLFKMASTPFAWYYLIFFVTQWTGEGWSYLVSLVFNQNRQVAAGVIALLFVIFTGAFPKLPYEPMR